MFVTTVAKSNKSVFENLAPEELLEPIDLPERFVLGAVKEDKSGTFAVGILIFEVWEGSNTEENMIAAVLKWLYVAEDFRQQGAADALMKELFRVLDKGGVETVICDLPMDEECNLLCAYLEAWGFTFALIDKYEAEVPLESLAEHPVFQNKKEDNVQPLTQVPAYLINQGLQKMSKQQGMLEGIENYLSLCDMEVSCAVIEQGEIKGLTLIRQLSEKKLEILASRSLSAKSENMINMIRFAEKKAYEKYSADTLVRIVCRIGATADLINYFFPDLMPPLMRRGVYTTGEEEE